MARRSKDAPSPEVQALVAHVLGTDDPLQTLRQLMSELATGMNPLGAPDPTITVPPPPQTPTVVTVKVSLDNARPPIWRRLELRGDLTLDRVHAQLQAAMGWDDYHLHRFEAGPVKNRWRAPYFLTELDLDEGERGTPEADVRLDQVLRAQGDRLFYTYDFGDDWAHTLIVEGVRLATDDDPPARVLKAVRACPPEDVGGIHTWNELAAALRSCPSPRALTGEFAMYADWLPEDVDPDAVNLADITDRLEAAGVPPLVLHPWVDSVIRRSPPELAIELSALAHQSGTPTLAPEAEELEVLLRPWQTLLEVAGGDGIRLTAAGWMVPAACERLWHESGIAWEIGKGNREQHTPELQLIRGHATTARLIRKYKGRLVLTPLGRQAATDPAVLTQALAASLLSATDRFDQDAQAIAVLLIAAGHPIEAEPQAGVGLSQPEWVFRAEVARRLTDLGWRHTDGPLPRYSVGEAAIVLALLTPRLGNAGGGPAPTSAAARHLARLALRS